MRFDQAPASDPHGRRPAAGPRRQQPAARPGTAQRTGPGHRTTGKGENARTGTAATTTTATRSPAAGSRPRTRRITRPAPGPATGEATRAEIGTTWRTADRRQAEPPGPEDHPAALLFADHQHDRTGNHDHREPGGDPHGQQPAQGPRRRRPAPGPGTARRTGPGHRDTGKEENTRTGTAARATGDGGTAVPLRIGQGR